MKTEITRKLCKDATEHCIAVGQNIAWLWEDILAKKILEDAIAVLEYQEFRTSAEILRNHYDLKKY